MKIRSNIVANCSDFVWSLDIPDIDGIRTALKTIVETTNWKVYASIEKFALDLHSKVIFPVDIDDIEFGLNPFKNININDIRVIIPICSDKPYYAYN